MGCARLLVEGRGVAAGVWGCPEASLHRMAGPGNNGWGKETPRTGAVAAWLELGPKARIKPRSPPAWRPTRSRRPDQSNQWLIRYLQRPWQLRLWHQQFEHTTNQRVGGWPAGP